MKLSNLKMRSYLVLIMALCFLMLDPAVATAQTITPAIMTLINADLQKRGLNESEVRVRLLKEGIDLENVPPADLPKYQPRVIAILDKMQAEKKAAEKTEVETTPAPVIGDVAKTPITTQKEAEVEAAQRVVQKAAAKDEPGNIYGHSLFTDQSLDVFRTTDGSRAPDTYILGTGDEIRISIFGASQTDMQLAINNDGYIQPTGMPKIFLQGLSLLQARNLLFDRLSSSYTFKPDQFAITIASARTIMVNIFGETKLTGGFNLSALNSAFNALSAAGGPTNIGSVRSILLIRGNIRKTIDLYAFMNDPAIQFKFDLQNNDIIFVPVVKLLVSIEGAVQRPMSYEMLPNETLSDLIRYAGDVKMDVFPDFVQIQRYTNGEQRLMEYNLEDVRSGKTKILLLNGDIVRIKAIGKPMDQYVDVEGSVYYPGRYDLSANPNLGNLLINAQPTLQAKTDLIFIERIRPDETVEQLSVNWAQLQNSGQVFQLNPRDRVRVADLANYRDVDTISVAGHVRLPFEKTFAINDRITVKQAIEMAGGLKTSVYPVAYIFRRNLFNPVEISYIRIELNQSDKIELQAGDQLNIYDNTTYTNVGEVRVFGAVKNPNGLTYDPSLTIRDILTHAGGFTVGAALNRVEIFRTILSPTERPKLELITLSVDSSYQIVSPKDFTLQPYDQVVVRLTPEFTMGRVVEITGQVEYPGTYLLESKQVNLSDIIKMAGGMLDDADPYGGRLFRTYRNRGNISMNLRKAMSHAGNLYSDPILFEGDVININRRENIVTIRENGTRMSQYSIYPVSNSKNVIYQGSRSAGWYIRNFAGGFQQRVDRNSVTVTLPNDQMRSTKHFLFMLRNYPNAKPGAIISMQMKPPKEKPVEGKKVDWENIWTKTVSTTTMALTLILMLQQVAK